MGRASSRHFTGARGSLAARAQARAGGELVTGEQISDELAASAQEGEDHLVTELAQRRTVEAIATLSHLMRSTRQSGAVRVRAAQVLLEWGWVKPGSAAAIRNKRPVGNDGGRGLTIVVKSAVPGSDQVTEVQITTGGEGEADAIDVTPHEPELVDL